MFNFLFKIGWTNSSKLKLIMYRFKTGAKKTPKTLL